ncbi:hypothetical protein MLD38_008263 [Melastoma candidum]|uniref:Uncharacterized protein n=1 Tax=Melastoma candidum TaxID=119954 RepID=A0ACB9S2A3_9MYRT|nr:hypothetical protein MLD38_008263 [Melastoma candidum]
MAGVEVRAGMQASLGPWKYCKQSAFVSVFVTLGGQNLVLGSLCPKTIPRLSFELVFDKDFVLSHNWKSGNVYFCGYFYPEESPLEVYGKSLLKPVAPILKPVASSVRQNQLPKRKVSFAEPLKVYQENDEIQADPLMDEKDKKGKGILMPAEVPVKQYQQPKHYVSISEPIQIDWEVSDSSDWEVSDSSEDEAQNYPPPPMDDDECEAILKAIDAMWASEDQVRERRKGRFWNKRGSLCG